MPLFYSQTGKPAHNLITTTQPATNDNSFNNVLQSRRANFTAEHDLEIVNLQGNNKRFPGQGKTALFESHFYLILPIVMQSLIIVCIVAGTITIKVYL